MEFSSETDFLQISEHIRERDRKSVEKIEEISFHLKECTKEKVFKNVQFIVRHVDIVRHVENSRIIV